MRILVCIFTIGVLSSCFQLKGQDINFYKVSASLNVDNNSIEVEQIMKFNAACLQLTSNDQPKENLDQVIRLSDQALQEGAQLICTPENTFLFTLDKITLEKKSEDYGKFEGGNKVSFKEFNKYLN